ncbi:MAG TPA: amidohydrolase family protein [Myxococcota bacterium]|nr:amidohydrolase family protein [Myxococcota bacterium]
MRPAIVDAHGHIYPDGLPRLRRVMKLNGLEAMINLSGGDLRVAPHWPEILAQEAKLAGEPPLRLYQLFNLDWRRRNAPGFGQSMARELEVAVKDHGYRGLKIPKLLGLYAKDTEGRRLPVDWPELDPVWAKAGELGVPVAIHTADPKAFWLAPTPDNERYEELALHPSWSFHGPEWPDRLALLGELERVFAKHPQTTFIAVHFGNNAEEPDYVERLLERYPNVYVDTAARLGEMGRHPPERIRALFERFSDRILFGTDLGLATDGIMLGSSGEEEPTEADIKPFFDAHWRYFEGSERGIAHPTPIQGRWTIDAIGLSAETLERVYRKNAARLFRLEGAGP